MNITMTQKDLKRFTDKIELAIPENYEACWNYTGGLSADGYGQFWLSSQRSNKRAHRIMYLIVYGIICRDEQINHRCDNRRCCNPDHLYAGTAKQNTQDSINRNRFVFNPGGPLNSRSTKRRNRDVKGRFR